MNNTKHHNDYESKNSNWLLQLENKWVYAHYNSIKHKKNCGFIPQSSGGQDAFDNIRFAIRGMLVGYIILLSLHFPISPYCLYCLVNIFF